METGRKRTKKTKRVGRITDRMRRIGQNGNKKYISVTCKNPSINHLSEIYVIKKCSFEKYNE